MSDDTITVDVLVKRMTPKAYLVWYEGGVQVCDPNAPHEEKWQEHWLPMSAVVATDCLAEGDAGWMEIKSWVLEKQGLEAGPRAKIVSTTDEMAGMEDQLQEARGNSNRLEVVVGVDPDQLPRQQGDIQINAYLTDEGLVVDVFHGDSTEPIATGYEHFSEAGLHPPEPIEPRTIIDTIRDEEEEF